VGNVQDGFKPPTDVGERCSDKTSVSTHESITTCSSTAVSGGTSSDSKHHETATSRHRKTTAAPKPTRVQAKCRPKKNVKSSVKGKPRPAPVPPQPGEQLPVEIIFTRSTVDITWQVCLCRDLF